MGLVDPLDTTLFQGPAAEIEQQAYLKAGASQVAIDLSERRIHKAFNRLGLDYNLGVHDQVHDLGIGSAEPLKGQIQANLPPDLNAIVTERLGKAELVGLFEPSWPKRLLSSNGRSNEAFGQRKTRMLGIPTLFPRHREAPKTGRLPVQRKIPGCPSPHLRFSAPPRLAVLTDGADPKGF